MCKVDPALITGWQMILGASLRPDLTDTACVGLEKELRSSLVDTYMLCRDIRPEGYESKLQGNIHLWRRRMRLKTCR